MTISTSRITGTLAPGADNPRNSEGAFFKLQDGRIAYAYSRYQGSEGGDHDECTISVVYSYDNGDSWDTDSIEKLVSASEFGEINVMSASLMPMANGDIGLFFMLKYPGLTSSYILRRYQGDFSHPLGDTVCLPQGYPAYYVVNNDRVLRMRNGTLVIPAARHASPVYPENRKNIDFHGQTQFFFSYDDGKSWRQGSATLSLNDPYSFHGLQEPGVMELPNHVLYCYSRTDRMYQYEAVSLDEGETWFGPRPSRFTSPLSPMLIKQNPYNGKYYAVWNPVPDYMTRTTEPGTAGRNPLVMAESTDGLHFSTPVILEDDLTRGYCYPAMYFLDEKTVLLSHCNGGKNEKCCASQTTFRKLILN